MSKPTVPAGFVPDAPAAGPPEGFALDSSAPTQPDSAASRFMTGATDPFFGAAQLITKGGAAAGIPGFAGDTGLAQSVDDYVKAREASYHGPANGEWDVARILGNIVSPVNLALGGGAVGASRAAAAAGASRLAAAAVGGAAGGAATGAVQPSTSGNFAGEKARQVGAGAALGAITGPIAQKIADVAGPLVSRALAASPEKIQVELASRLEQQGVDWASLGKETQDYITQQVQHAGKIGSIPDDFLGNLATLKEAGIDRPTLGQVTQNPTQTGTELVLRNQEAGADLATQHQLALTALNRKLAEVAGKMPPALDRPDAGGRVIQGLAAAAKRGDTYEDALWSVARDQMGRDAPIGEATGFARGAIQKLDDANALEALPNGIRSRLESLRDGQGELTVDVAENLKNALNIARENPTAKGAGQTNYALGVVRRELESFLDTATGADQVRGIEFFRQARAASRDRRVLENAIPALQDVRTGVSETAPDDFIQKYAIGPAAKVSDATALRDFLAHADPGALNQIRGQIVYGLRQAATKGESGKFLQDTYNTKLTQLRDSGKLAVWFTPAERQTLETIGRAGKLVEGPQGVPRTGLLSGARGAETLSRIISGMGRLVPGAHFITDPIAGAVENTGRRGMAAAALTPRLAPPVPEIGAAASEPVTAALETK